MNVTVLYLLAVNVIAFVLYGVDKYRAKNDLWRIPEANLILFAIIGGAAGSLMGMFFFHHKTKKQKFLTVVPLCLLAWIVIIFKYSM